MENKNKHKRRVMKLCALLNIDHDERHDMIGSFTNNRTRSTKGMTDDELKKLADSLQMQYDKTPEGTSCNLMRSKIMAHFHHIKWEKGNGLDYVRIKSWMLKYSYLKKPLNQYSYAELPKLVSQVEKITVKENKEEVQ